MHLIKAKHLIINSSQVLKDHGFVIENKLIVDILPNSEISKKYPNTPTTTYDKHAVFPGFVNAHTHIPMNLFRCLADDLPLMEWLNNYIWPIEAKFLSFDFCKISSTLAIAEMLRCGTTCFNDMYFYSNAIAQAAKEAKIRAYIGSTIIDFPTSYAKTSDEYFAKAQDLMEQYRNDPLITCTVEPHGPYTVCDKNLLRAKAITDKAHSKLAIHLHETQDEIDQSLEKYNMRPIKRLFDLGVLDKNTIAIHMANLNDEDIELTQKSGINIIHCPESNMKIASGICPVQKLLDLGLNVAIATDGAASNNDLNMIGELKTAAFLAKLTTQDPTALNSKTVFAMGTIHGAKALGMTAKIGTIEVGKEADFACIDLEQIETMPHFDIISAIVYAASRTQVTDTWVAGNQLMKNRQLLTIDEDKLLNETKLWATKIKA